MINKRELPGYIIHLINHAFLQKKNELLSKYNITSSQNKVLICLWENDGQHQSDIQKDMDIKGSSMTKLIEQLEKKNLVERRGCDKDSRAKRVYLTDVGKNIRHQSIEIVMELEAVLVKGFEEKEKKDLLSYLDRMLDNITEGRL